MNIFHWRYDGESALQSSLRCQAAVIKTIARHCTSTSRIARTLALRSAPPLEVVYRQPSRSSSFRRLLAQHLSLSDGRRAGRGRCRRVVNHTASHSTRDRRRRRRHRALPSRPPASRRVFRDVFTFPTVFGKSPVVLLNCVSYYKCYLMDPRFFRGAAFRIL